VQTKKRILFCNEASFISSGYGTYGHAVLNHLYDTGKYDVAELATYGLVNDPRDKDIRWKYYANMVKPDDPRWQEYKSSAANEFGAWRFERTLLDFKPDIVFSIRDPYEYIMAFEGNSPLRRFFHYAIMPTVDSSPQQHGWIDYFTRADGVLTYSEWGQSVLAKQGCGLIPLKGTASPGVDIDIFKPVPDKKLHRQEMGFDDDAIIIGTVMRNQRRKLYPDLMKSFKDFLAKAPKDIAEKSYLYLHTSYPEPTGWNIPQLILEYGLSNRVLITYCCRNCKHAFGSYFQDAKTVCPRCNSLTATFTSVINGVDRNQLSNILNLFDVYVQYSNVEGFGLPLIEGAACGLPIFATDSSAMSEIVKKTHGYTINVLKFNREIELGADRAIPDNNHFVEQLIRFFTQPKEMQVRRSQQARKGVEQNYTWKITGKKWESYFDSVELSGVQGKWDAPPQFIQPRNIPDNLNNADFVRWGIVHILNKPELLNSYMELNLVKELNYGNPDIRKKILDRFLKTVTNHNHVEQCRIQPNSMDVPDFIQYANLKHG